LRILLARREKIPSQVTYNCLPDGGDWADRDFANYEIILSGDIDGDGTFGEYAMILIRCP